MAVDDRTRWNRRYRSGDAPRGDRPDRGFAAQQRVPVALDVACGAGGTVHWLAQATRVAAEAGLTGRTHFFHADLVQWRPAPDSYDCIRFATFWAIMKMKSSRSYSVRPGPR